MFAVTTFIIFFSFLSFEALSSGTSRLVTDKRLTYVNIISMQLVPLFSHLGLKLLPTRLRFQEGLGKSKEALPLYSLSVLFPTHPGF